MPRTLSTRALLVVHTQRIFEGMQEIATPVNEAVAQAKADGRQIVYLADTSGNGGAQWVLDHEPDPKDVEEAGAGIHDFRVLTKDVMLVGGWWLACTGNAIIGAMFGHFSPQPPEPGPLLLRIPMRATSCQGETLYQRFDETSDFFGGIRTDVGKMKQMAELLGPLGNTLPWDEFTIDGQVFRVRDQRVLTTVQLQAGTGPRRPVFLRFEV
ncbi:MAG: hypothetical protein AAF799_03910 [Myxococcota bacterium]